LWTIKILGWWWTILPTEIEDCRNTYCQNLFPDDGRTMGLEGMIQDVIDQHQKGNFKLNGELKNLNPKEWKTIAGYYAGRRWELEDLMSKLKATPKRSIPETAKVPVLGITGTGGAGKSSVTMKLFAGF